MDEWTKDEIGNEPSGEKIFIMKMHSRNYKIYSLWQDMPLKQFCFPPPLI